jgi:hypothetical protein
MKITVEFIFGAIFGAAVTMLVFFFKLGML